MAETISYAQQYRKGLDLFTAGHYNEALTTFKKVLVLEPEFPDAYFKIACIYADMNRFADALSMFEKVRTLLPNDLEVCYTYGKTLLKSGNEKKGLKVLREAMKLNPRDPRARFEIARHFMNQEKVRKALSVIEQGIKIDPDYAPYYGMAGDLLRRLKKWSKAQDYYEQCLELDPEFDAAKRGFNAVVRVLEGDGTGDDLSPEDEAREEMVEVAALYREKKYDEAIVRLLDLKDLPGIEREASMLLGLSFARKGLYKRAHDVLLAFTKQHRADISVWYNLGLAANRMGRYASALDYLAEALDMDKDFEEALIEMGIASQMTGDYAAAQKYFLRALKIDKTDPRPYAYLARMAFEKNEQEKVDEFLKRGKACKADHPSILLVQGYIALVEGDAQKALPFLQKCVDQSPDHFEALKLLGRAQYELEDFQGVRDSFQAAAALNPSDMECRELLQELAAHTG